jgi:hypothetical protein
LGSRLSLITAQPILYYNFQYGWYFRSDAIMQFNTYSHTNVIPVGLGVGRVLQLEGGYVLNSYVEVQPSVFRSGRGGTLPPYLQIVTGIPNPVTDELDERLELLKGRRSANTSYNRTKRS